MEDLSGTKFQNPIADEEDDAGISSHGNRSESGSASPRRGHQLGHKLAETLASGVDPYVRCYTSSRGHASKKTTSVLSLASNQHGRCPVWGSHDHHEMVLKPAPSETTLTVEVWDEDVDSDDLLGGRQVLLDDLRALCRHSGFGETGMTNRFSPKSQGSGDWTKAMDDVEADGVIHLQLFADAGMQGRDAGVMRVQVKWPEGGDLVIIAHAAVDLLSDTPDIRDMSTFSDWYTVKITLVLFFMFVSTLTLYFVSVAATPQFT